MQATDTCLRITEAVYRLCNQRSAIVSIHAEESQLVQVPCLASGRLVALRVLHYGDDRHEHGHTHDEGAISSPLAAPPEQLEYGMPFHVTPNSLYAVFKNRVHLVF